MRRSAAALGTALAMVTVALMSSPSTAITRGSVDGNVHPYVGALFYPGSSFPICSGALVRSASRGVVLLTVAHCLVGTSKRRDVTVSFASVVGTGTRIPGTFIPDPAYHPGAPDPHDLAVVVFAHPPAISPIATMARVGTVPRLLPRNFTTVGYGVTPGGVRKNAVEQGTFADGRWLYLRPVNGNSCYADSGGPDLLGTPEKPVVAAVTDQGPCFGRGSFDQDFRVDTVSAHHFVDHV